MVRFVPRFVVAIFGIAAALFPAVEIGFFAYETYDAYSVNAGVERSVGDAIILFEGDLDAAPWDSTSTIEARAYWQAAGRAYIDGDVILAQQALHVADARLHGKDVKLLEDGDPIDLSHLLPATLRGARYDQLFPSCDDAAMGHGCTSTVCDTTVYEGVGEKTQCEVQVCRPQYYGLSCHDGAPMPPDLPTCVSVTAGNIAQWCATTACTDSCDDVACQVWQDGTREGDCMEVGPQVYVEQPPPPPPPPCSGQTCPAPAPPPEMTQGAGDSFSALVDRLQASSAEVGSFLKQTDEAPSFPVWLVVVPSVLAVAVFAVFLALGRSSGAPPASQAPRAGPGPRGPRAQQAPMNRPQGQAPPVRGPRF